jgi:hypothetical protein
MYIQCILKNIQCILKTTTYVHVWQQKMALRLTRMPPSIKYILNTAFENIFIRLTTLGSHLKPVDGARVVLLNIGFVSFSCGTGLSISRYVFINGTGATCHPHECRYWGRCHWGGQHSCGRRNAPAPH